jgi:hypothetical protein
MSMADRYAELVTGAALSIEILIRHLEREGVLEKGSYRDALEQHLSHVSPVRRDKPMYAVPKELVKALGKPAPVARRKH